MKSIFIGGANDGKSVEVPDLPIVRLPIPSHMHRSGVETEDYRKERLATEKQVFEFYVSQSLSLESALLKLLARYERT